MTVKFEALNKCFVTVCHIYLADAPHILSKSVQVLPGVVSDYGSGSC